VRGRGKRQGGAKKEIPVEGGQKCDWRYQKGLKRCGQRVGAGRDSGRLVLGGVGGGGGGGGGGGVGGGGGCVRSWAAVADESATKKKTRLDLNALRMKNKGPGLRGSVCRSWPCKGAKGGCWKV